MWRAGVKLIEMGARSDVSVHSNLLTTILKYIMW